MATKKATIKRKISAIEFSKEQMRKAIESKGPTVSKSDAFSTYADKIREITSGDFVEDLGSISITQNGTTNPGTNKGYSNVEVSVSGNVQPYGETVTKNGTISASGDIDGYSSITVQVVGKDGKPIGEKKKAHGLGTKTITKNGVYKAEDDGYKGYSQVNVQVVKKDDEKDEGQKYTVTFKNKDGTTLQTVENVPFGGAAAYTGEEPTLASMDKIGYWYGWNPVPFDIRKDTECYAIYGDFNAGYTDSNEIKDNWDKICSNRGSKYRVGQWRLLCLGETEYDYTASDLSHNNFEECIALNNTSGLKTSYKDEDPHNVIKRFNMVRMMKVADGGSDGSTSTWISIDHPGIIVLDWNTDWDYIGSNDPVYENKSKWNKYNWEFRIARKFLNEYLMKAMPKCLQDTILEVEKVSSGLIYEGDHAGEWYPNIKTNDKIWTPSRREIYGNKRNKVTYQTRYSGPIYETYEIKPDEKTGKFYETEGPTYASAFTNDILCSMCERFGHKKDRNEMGVISLRSIPYLSSYEGTRMTFYNACIGHKDIYYTMSDGYGRENPAGYVKGAESNYTSYSYAHYSWPAIGFCL